MQTYIIFDLDNTISDDEWRMDRIQWQHKDPTRRYQDYHLLAGFDRLGNHLLLGQALDAGHQIIISTARPIAYRAITMEWLRRANLSQNVAALLMRNNDDHRCSVELKRDHINWLYAFHNIVKSQIIHAYDDREDVCAMFRSEGIAATAKPLHKICAMTQPKKENEIVYPI